MYYEKHFKGLFVLTVVALLVCKVSNKKETSSQYLLENIEALAGGEEPVIQRCYSSGSLVCPINNSKVEYIVEHYGLQ